MPIVLISNHKKNANPLLMQLYLYRFQEENFISCNFTYAVILSRVYQSITFMKWKQTE